MAATSPSARQRELEKRLRELRDQHGYIVEDVADKLLCSATKISRLETGPRRPSLRAVLFEFEENTNQSPVVFVEGLTGNQYFEKPADISRYREALEYLRDTALSPRDSVQLVAEMQKAYADKRLTS